MGALQVVPTFLRRFMLPSHENPVLTGFTRPMYNLVTKGGRALDILISRLLKAVSPDPGSWDEEEPLKSVSLQ